MLYTYRVHVRTYYYHCIMILQPRLASFRCPLLHVGKGAWGSRGFERTPRPFKKLSSYSLYYFILSFVGSSLALLPLRISVVETSLIVASTAFVHGGPAGERERARMRY